MDDGYLVLIHNSGSVFSLDNNIPFYYQEECYVFISLSTKGIDGADHDYRWNGDENSDIFRGISDIHGFIAADSAVPSNSF